MAKYSNKDFGADMKKAYKGKKKKSSANPQSPLAYGPAMNGAMRNTKVFGGPTQPGMKMPTNANPSWAKQKKSKKAKKATKNDHDADDMKKAKSSKQIACKMCKTSHVPGKHAKKSTKKKS